VDRDWRLVIDVNVGGSPNEIRGALAGRFDAIFAQIFAHLS